MKTTAQKNPTRIPNSVTKQVIREAKADAKFARQEGARMSSRWISSSATFLVDMITRQYTRTRVMAFGFNGREIRSLRDLYITTYKRVRSGR